jgi:hypothetical protein
VSASDTGACLSYPGMDDTEIITLFRAASVPEGERNASLLMVMNAAGNSGWTNHQILLLGSGLAVRWGISDPDKNLFGHWRRLMQMLANVRRHYPAPGNTAR